MDQVIVYGSVVLIVVVGALVLRYTEIGLRVRDGRLAGHDLALGYQPGIGAASLGVWAVSTALAGLVGVLAAPIIGLDPGDFTLLMVGLRFAAG